MAAGWRMFMLAALLCAAPPATAATRVPTTIAALPKTIDGGDIEAIARIVQDAGYKARVKVGEDGTRYIDSAANGVSFTINFTDCKQGESCRGIRFFAWWPRPAAMDDAAVNEWNNGYRIARAAIDRDGDLALDYFVSLVGGVATANFLDSFDWWALLIGNFRSFIEDKKAKAASVPAKAGGGEGLSAADEDHSG